jgi:hypothetical protein
MCCFRCPMAYRPGQLTYFDRVIRLGCTPRYITTLVEGVLGQNPSPAGADSPV